MTQARHFFPYSIINIGLVIRSEESKMSGFENYVHLFNIVNEYLIYDVGQKNKICCIFAKRAKTK